MINGIFPVNKQLLTISNLIRNFLSTDNFQPLFRPDQQTTSTDVNFWYHHAQCPPLAVCTYTSASRGEKPMAEFIYLRLS
jgi:hypothetical protein